MNKLSDDWAWFSPQQTDHEENRADAVNGELTKSFARTFGQHDGEKVLAHLRSMTKERALGPDSPDATLRYLEGQRSLVTYMERMIERGRV